MSEGRSKTWPPSSTSRYTCVAFVVVAGGGGGFGVGAVVVVVVATLHYSAPASSLSQVFAAAAAS